MDPQVLAAIRKSMGQCRAPTAHQKVYKDECMYTFDK
jgi:hypothetical protein